LYLDPPLEQARAAWISQFHAYLGVVCNLSRLKSSRFDVFGFSGEASFADLARRIPQDMVTKAYEAIQSLFYQVAAYVDNWLQYQALWDMNSQVVYDRLGDDMSAWLGLLTEMKTARRLSSNLKTAEFLGRWR